MSILKSFAQGIKQVNSNKKMLFTLYIFNFAFALIITAPLYSFLSSVLGRSLMADDLIGRFDLKFLVEFIPQHIDALRPFKGLIFVTVIAFFLLSSFLAGGIISRFKNPEKKPFLTQFFQGAGAYFLRFLRLLLISFIFYGIAIIIFLILQLLIGLGIENPMLSMIIPGIIFLFSLLFIAMLFDYAKIKTVVENKKGMFRTTFEALKFIFRHFGKTLGLYYLILIIALILIVILIIIKWMILPTNWGLILLLFLVQQVIIIARLWIRMLFFSGQLQLYGNAAK